MSEEKRCANCLSLLEPEHKYCPECGQKVDDDLTISVLFSNTISNYFSVDARFFKSFLPLLIKPGYLPFQFVKGKRLTFLHPAQMYLFISVVFFFLFSFIARDTAANFDKALKNDLNTAKKEVKIKPLDSMTSAKISESIKKNKDNFGLSDEDLQNLDSLTSAARQEQNFDSGLNFATKEIDSLIATGKTDAEIKKALNITSEDGWLKNKLSDQFLKFYRTRKGSTFLQAFYDSIPIAMFLLLPIFALLLKIFFFKTGRYAHHLVFTFYYFAFIFTVFSLDLLANSFIDKVPGWIDAIIVLSIFVYLFIGIKKFYQKSWVTSFFKTGFIVFFFIFPLILLAIGLIFTAFLTY